MKRYSDYARGRADGIQWAYDLAKKESIEALEREAKLRGSTGIYPAGRFDKDLDAQVDSIIAHAMKRVFIISVAAIHDVYGFGPKRMQKFFDAFSEGTRLLMKGRAGGAFWTDYASEIQKIYGIRITANTEGVIVEEKRDGDKG